MTEHDYMKLRKGDKVRHLDGKTYTFLRRPRRSHQFAICSDDEHPNDQYYFLYTSITKIEQGNGINKN